MKGHENTTLRPTPPPPAYRLSASAARLVAVGRPASEASPRGAIPADQASIRGEGRRPGNSQHGLSACQETAASHCTCSDNFGGVCSSVDLRKVLENICGSTAAINIFTFACGKTKPPGLPHLLVFPHSTPPNSNRILTRVAVPGTGRDRPPPWRGQHCRPCAGTRPIVDHLSRARITDCTKKKGPANSALLSPEWLEWFSAL